MSAARARDLAFFNGYQEALLDIAAAINEGGIARALMWIEDNSHDERVRECARDARNEYEGSR